jgi:hypothetical protein
MRLRPVNHGSCRSALTSRFGVGAGPTLALDRAQAVAGELLPGASRTQELWLDLIAGATGLLKRVQNHRIDLADALARRAELRGGLGQSAKRGARADRAPRAAPGLEDEDPVRTPRTPSPRTCRAAWRPTWSGRSLRASPRNVWRSNTAGEG